MSVTFQAPNAGSVISATGSLPQSACNAVWIGFMTPLSSSGCVVIYKDASPVAGSALFVINASPGQVVGPFGPFFMPGGFSTSSITGGCVLYQVML